MQLQLQLFIRRAYQPRWETAHATAPKVPAVTAATVARTPSATRASSPDLAALRRDRPALAAELPIPRTRRLRDAAAIAAGRTGRPAGIRRVAPDVLAAAGALAAGGVDRAGPLVTGCVTGALCCCCGAADPDFCGAGAGAGADGVGERGTPASAVSRSGTSATGRAQ